MSFDFDKTYRAIQRESATEKKVRSMDADEIVDWIRGLEDRLDRVDDAISELENYPENGGAVYWAKKLRSAAEERS